MSIPKLFFYFSLTTAVLFFILISSSFVLAQSADAEKNIQFPVAELNNCNSKEECKAYCDNPENMSACVAFAEKHGLMSKKEVERARKFEVLEQRDGPGGCTDHKSCEAYCSDVNNIDECVAFAEEHGLMDEKELDEAKKVRTAIRNGVKFPGGCTSKESCEAYCSDDANVDECLAFAEASGFIPPEELENAKKVIPLIKRGETPGGCRSKEQCEAFCSNEANANECADFAERAGFIKPEEAEILRKTGGRGPGGCQGKEQCEAFCSNEDNAQVCVDFAERHNLISEERRQNIDQARNHFKEAITKAPASVVSCIESSASADVIEKIKTNDKFLAPRELAEKIKTCFETNIPKGPGGCNSKDSCEAFCSDENNREECFSFAKDRGQLPEEVNQEGQHNIGDAIRNAPQEVANCFESNFDSTRLEKIKSGAFLPNQETGNIIKKCFEESRPQNGENRPPEFNHGEAPVNGDPRSLPNIPEELLEKLKEAEESGDQELIEKIKREIPNLPPINENHSIDGFRRNIIDNQIRDIPQDVKDQIEAEGLTIDEYKELYEKEFRVQEDGVRGEFQREIFDNNPPQDNNDGPFRAPSDRPENHFNPDFNPRENFKLNDDFRQDEQFRREPSNNDFRNHNDQRPEPDQNFNNEPRRDENRPQHQNNPGPSQHQPQPGGNPGTPPPGDNKPPQQEEKIGEQGASLLDIFFGFLKR